MKPPSFPLPTPLDIMENSEIATLYLLFEFLEVAGRTIIAAHPNLINQDPSPWAGYSREEQAAERLLANLDRLAKSILRYKKTIAPLSISDYYNSHGISPNQRKIRKRHSSLRQLNLPFLEPEIPPF
jgi:hypothetical protein